MPPKKFGAVVSNHTTPVDVIIMGSLFKPCMVAKSALRSVPFLGRTFDLLGTIYVDRSDPNSKHNTVESIMKQQKRCIEGESDYPVGIFPEGTTSNNEVLLPFKQGVFYSKTSVQPIVLKVNGKYLKPTYDCVGFMELVILIFVQWSYKLTVYKLPVF